MATTFNTTGTVLEAARAVFVETALADLEEQAIAWAEECASHAPREGAGRGWTVTQRVAVGGELFVCWFESAFWYDSTAREGLTRDEALALLGARS